MISCTSLDVSTLNIASLQLGIVYVFLFRLKCSLHHKASLISKTNKFGSCFDLYKRVFLVYLSFKKSMKFLSHVQKEFLVISTFLKIGGKKRKGRDGGERIPFVGVVDENLFLHVVVGVLE
jgi:hypothetical protein